MATSDIRGVTVFHDNVTFLGTTTVPADTIKSSQFSSTATDRLVTSKQVHRIDFNYDQDTGSDVVTDTRMWRVARGAGTVLGMDVRPITAPTGGDKAFTVDFQKAADASGSWSSLLNSVVTVNSSSTDNTKQSATLAATPTFTAGSALRLVVTASGSTGSQGQGVIVSVYIDEDPS